MLNQLQARHIAELDDSLGLIDLKLGEATRGQHFADKADGLSVPSLVLFPYDPADRDDWHSRHPGSINLMARPSEPIDVNALEWDEVERAVERFCYSLDRDRGADASPKL